MILGRTTVALVTVSCAVATGCAAASSADGSSSRSGIVATTSIWADITSSVLCGQDVAALVPAGADPHTFEPSLRDREAVGRASLVVANGAGLEGRLADLLDAAPTVVEVADATDVIDGDPHIWQDPRRVATAAAAIADAATDVDNCLDDYTTALDQLDKEIVDLLAPIPAESRIMVTSHDSLSYFAARYGLEVVGTVIPATNTLAETNARDLDLLADLIDERGVSAIFTDKLASSSDATALAERLGVRVVPLVTDALTTDPASDTYLEMMRSNATRIAEALTP